ncbi:MAG: glycosyltransferase family 4 protein, partial [Verrucomicrobiota bacterium]
MKTPKIFRNKKELLFGNIESISESSVSGWLTHRDHTKLPVTVEIVLNDTVIGNGIADTFREDLSQQGLGDCGFNIVFNQKIEPMRLIEDGTILSNGKEYAVAEFAKSNELLRSKEHIPQITGSIDRVDSLMIGGWMKIEGVNSAAPFIIFSLRDKIIAYAIAGQARPDLEAAGIGARGFQCVPLRPYSISNFLKHGIAEVNGYATNVSKFTQSLSPHSDAQKVESDRPLLYFWPDNREHNCYLDAIYSAQDSKIECQPGDLEDAINEIENGNRKVVFHLHWVTPVIGPVRSDSRRHAVERFVARLRNFQQLGGKVVWTVHNLLGHDADRRAWQLSLSRKVADIADLILVHNQEVQRRICETYRTTSSKIKIVDHPSYEGFYKNEISRKEARQQLRIKPNSIVFGFIGQLRPYKGIEELVIAFAKFRQRHPQAELIIAGRRVHPFDLRALAAKTKAIPGIHLYEGHIKNDDLQLYYKAIDASVLPYRDILTSGSVLCSASFSVPVIGPMCPALSAVVEDNVSGILYKTSSSLTENAHAIESCMGRFSELSATEVDKMNLSILESVDQLQPRKISERLFSEVFEVLEKTKIQREHEYRGVKYFCSEAFHTRETTAAAIVLNYGDPSKARNTIKSLKESEDGDNLE